MTVPILPCGWPLTREQARWLRHRNRVSPRFRVEAWDVSLREPMPPTGVR